MQAMQVLVYLIGGPAVARLMWSRGYEYVPCGVMLLFWALLGGEVTRYICAIIARVMGI